MDEPTNETWMPIAAFNDAYEASDAGRVRGTHRKDAARPRRGLAGSEGEILRAKMNERGYPDVWIPAPYLKGVVGVHRCMLLAFVGPPPTPEHVACFLDGDPTNLSLSNLRWLTPLGRHDKMQDAGRGAVRATKILNGLECYFCNRCQLWFPIKRFRPLALTLSKHGRPNSQCGRAPECMACETDRRREHRQRIKKNGLGRSETLEEIANRLLPLFGKVSLDGDAEPTVGAILKAIRVRRGLTQRDVASRMGMTNLTLGRIENGRQLPREKTLLKFLAVYNPQAVPLVD